jgi:hypothetical protein
MPVSRAGDDDTSTETLKMTVPVKVASLRNARLVRDKTIPYDNNPDTILKL